MVIGERTRTATEAKGLSQGNTAVRTGLWIVVLILPFAFCLTGCQQQPRKPQPLTDPDSLNAVVWTTKLTGTYYCGDSLMFGKDQGSYMKQAKALDSGYQPEFGAYCTGRETSNPAKPGVDRLALSGTE